MLSACNIRQHKWSSHDHHLAQQPSLQTAVAHCMQHVPCWCADTGEPMHACRCSTLQKAGRPCPAWRCQTTCCTVRCKVLHTHSCLPSELTALLARLQSIRLLQRDTVHVCLLSRHVTQSPFSRCSYRPNLLHVECMPFSPLCPCAHDILHGPWPRSASS